MAAEQPPPEGSKPLSGLLSGIAQATYYGHAGITEELLRGQLYPEAAPHEFRALLAKMSGVLKVAAPAAGQTGWGIGSVLTHRIGSPRNIWKTSITDSD
uniref:COMMD1 N-terminal domain-containing protein n=1 Tax=Chrysemys picta bellii TaxID=8478 RepID=A0A8C3FQA3_CHRPI